MSSEKRNEFLKQCRNVAIHWGNKMPMLAMEEAGELIQAISKFERKFDEEDGKYIWIENERQNLISEIGDMYISLMALQINYEDFICVGEVEEYINKKLNKEYD